MLFFGFASHAKVSDQHFLFFSASRECLIFDICRQTLYLNIFLYRVAPCYAPQIQLSAYLSVSHPPLVCFGPNPVKLMGTMDKPTKYWSDVKNLLEYLEGYLFVNGYHEPHEESMIEGAACLLDMVCERIALSRSNLDANDEVEGLLGLIHSEKSAYTELVLQMARIPTATKCRATQKAANCHKVISSRIYFVS